MGARPGQPGLRGATGRAVAVEEDDEPQGIGFGRGFLIVLLMFVLGAGGAFGYFRMSTPHAPASSVPSVPTVTPAGTGTPTGTGTPAASPTGTPKS